MSPPLPAPALDWVAPASSRSLPSRGSAKDSRKLASRQPKLSPKVRSSECSVWIVSATPIGGPKSTGPPGDSGSISCGASVAQHHRRQRDLVDQRAQRVGNAEPGGGLEVAAGGADLDALRRQRAPPRRDAPSRSSCRGSTRSRAPPPGPRARTRRSARAGAWSSSTARRGRGSGSRFEGRPSSRRG